MVCAEHPRLLARASDWMALEARRKTDPALNAFVETVCAQACEVALLPPLERVLEGHRLLGVSREFLQRILLTAFAWRVTGNRKFVEISLNNMQSVTAFSDWNPAHFLDVAEMTAGLAIGYDWLYSELTPEFRSAVRLALVEKGLQPGMTDNNWWWIHHNNWNQVCIGSLALAALAMAEDEPVLCREFLAKARLNVRNGLNPYLPDGIYPEGPMYWDYGTSFQIVLIEALYSALGDDWGLSLDPALLGSADFYAHATGPSSETFNFADCSPKAWLALPLFAMAHRQHRPELLTGESERLADVVKGHKKPGRLGPLLALWWPDSAGALAGAVKRELPLFWSGQGPNSLAMWRSGGDTNALYFAIKGGGAAVSHGHMDGGSFVMEAGGIRWAEDLGMESYHEVERRGIDLWNPAQDSGRWRLFRIGNFSHNTLTVDGQLHNANGLARLVSASPEGALLDLTPIFLPDTVARAERRVQFAAPVVTLTDTLSGLKPGTPVRWAMVTGATVTVAGSTATLSKGGKQLQVRFEGEGVELEVQSAVQPEGVFNSANPDRCQLLATVRATAAGEALIVTFMTIQEKLL